MSNNPLNSLPSAYSFERPTPAAKAPITNSNIAQTLAKFAPPSSGPINLTGGYSQTARQEVQNIQQHKPAQSLLGSIENGVTGGLGDIWHGTASGLGTALNYLNRPEEAVASALQAGGAPGAHASLGQIGSSFLSGLENKTHASGFSLLQQQYPHFMSHHKILGALAGFAATVGTDPLMLAGAGEARVPELLSGLKSSKDIAALDASRNIGVGADAATRAVSAQKAMDAIQSARQENKAFSARYAYANAVLRHANAEMNPASIGNDATKLNMMQADAEALSTIARAEERATTKGALELRLHIPGVTKPLSYVPRIGDHTIPLPSIAGAARVLPGPLGTGAEKVGQFLKPGFTTAKDTYMPGTKPLIDTVGEAEASMAARRISENLRNIYMRAYHFQLGAESPFAHMPQQAKDAAIHWGETNPIWTGALEPNSIRELDTQAIDAAVSSGKLTQMQGAYIKASANFGEQLRRADAMSGAKSYLPHQGTLYFPHVLHDQTEGYIMRRRSQFPEVNGFKQIRINPNSTLQDLKDNAQTADKVVADHQEAWAARIYASARDQATGSMLRAMRDAGGVPAKVTDMEKFKALVQKEADLKAAMEKNFGSLDNQAGYLKQLKDAVIQKHTSKINGLFAKHNARLSDIQERIHAIEDHPAGPRTPSYTNFNKWGRSRFRAAIQHMSPADRKAALEAHGQAAEIRRLRNKLNRLGSPKGGPTPFKGLSQEVNDLSKRMGNDVQAHAPAARGESWRGNIDTHLQGVETQNRFKYNEVAGRYPNPRRMPSEALRARLARAYENEVSRLAAAIAKETDRTKSELATAHESWFNRIGKDGQRYSKMQDKLANVRRAIDKTPKMRNPAIPAGWTKEYSRAIDGQKYYFHPELHAAMSRVEKVNESNWKGMQKAMQYWKLAVTTANPGYHFRNSFTNIWNMYIAGVPMSYIISHSGQVVKQLTDARDAADILARGGDLSKLSKDQLAAYSKFQEAYQNRALFGLFQDVQASPRGSNHILSDVARAREYLKAGRPDKAAIKAIQDFGRSRENWERVLHYNYRRQYMNAADAAAWVRKAHFDYEELTKAEKVVRNNFVPFYIWTRKNIPYQLEQILSRPGKFNMAARIPETANYAATGNEWTPGKQDSLMPSWMRESYAFHVPSMGILPQNSYAIPSFLGYGDLAKVEPAAHGSPLLQMLGPQYQAMMAGLMGINPQTGEKFSASSHPLSPTGTLGEAVASLLGGNTGTTARMVNGKAVQGPGVSPETQYFENQIPFLNWAFNQGNKIQNAQRGGHTAANLRYIFGIPTYTRDYGSEVRDAAYLAEQAAQKQIKGMRDSGKLPTKTRRTSRSQAIINQLLVQNGG